MKHVYKVLTPALGALKGAAWRKQRYTGKVLGEGVSTLGVPLLRVRFFPKVVTGRSNTHTDIDLGKGEFTERNPSNAPTVFFFMGKWWVRAKRSRRKWETALKLGSHVICHSNFTLNKSGLRSWGWEKGEFGYRPSFVATWLPYEKRNKDGSRTTLLYEVHWA